MKDGKRIGLALGGGGARGLAHIAALEVLDGSGVVPDRLAGTSMGAILGALYASGRPAREIRALVEGYIITKDKGLRGLRRRADAILRWLRSITPAWSRRGLLKSDGAIRFLLEEIRAETFEELDIPLRVVATDYRTGRAAVFDSGPLRPAIQASMAIPGIFVPVEHEGRTLVDGGVVNNLPYDLLGEDCDITIALDAGFARPAEDTGAPHLFDAVLGMFDLLVARLTEARVEASPPGIHFRHSVSGVGLLEFDKMEAVLERSRESMPEFESLLRRAGLAGEGGDGGSAL